MQALAFRQQLRGAAVVCAVWTLVAAWHPFYLGFFSDDWSLFVPTINDHSINELTEKYPHYPRDLLQIGIDPHIVAARPGYAFALFGLKFILTDSVFLWQLTSALLLLVASSTVYILAFELLRQYEYKPRECQFGSTVAASVYLIGPWSIVMSAWSTVAITLISQIYVIIGLTNLASSWNKNPLRAACFMLVGFIVYEILLASSCPRNGHAVGNGPLDDP